MSAGTTACAATASATPAISSMNFWISRFLVAWCELAHHPKTYLLCWMVLLCTLAWSAGNQKYFLRLFSRRDRKKSNSEEAPLIYSAQRLPSWVCMIFVLYQVGYHLLGTLFLPSQKHPYNTSAVSWKDQRRRLWLCWLFLVSHPVLINPR